MAGRMASIVCSTFSRINRSSHRGWDASKLNNPGCAPVPGEVLYDAPRRVATLEPDPRPWLRRDERAAAPEVAGRLRHRVRGRDRLRRAADRAPAPLADRRTAR